MNVSLIDDIAEDIEDSAAEDDYGDQRGAQRADHA